MNKYLKDPAFLRELIMDHYQYPRNHHLFPEDQTYLEQHMAADSCIDDIKVQAKIKDGVIEDLVFDGVACVISTASTSMMTELLKGKTLDQARQIIEAYHQMVDLKEVDESLLQEAVAFQNVGKQANRVGCALIGWKAAEIILEESEKDHDEKR